MTVRIQCLSLGLQLCSTDKIELSMSGILDVNTPHCTVGHYHPSPAGTSLGWHGDQVIPSAMQKDVSGWQHTYLHTSTLAGSKYNNGQDFQLFRLTKAAVSTSFLIHTGGHANTHSLTHAYI